MEISCLGSNYLKPGIYSEKVSNPIQKEYSGVKLSYTPEKYSYPAPFLGQVQKPEQKIRVGKDFILISPPFNPVNQNQFHVIKPESADISEIKFDLKKSVIGKRNTLTINGQAVNFLQTGYFEIKDNQNKLILSSKRDNPNYRHILTIATDKAVKTKKGEPVIANFPLPVDEFVNILVLTKSFKDPEKQEKFLKHLFLKSGYLVQEKGKYYAYLKNDESQAKLKLSVNEQSQLDINGRCINLPDDIENFYLKDPEGKIILNIQQDENKHFIINADSEAVKKNLIALDESSGAASFNLVNNQPAIDQLEDLCFKEFNSRKTKYIDTSEFIFNNEKTDYKANYKAFSARSFKIIIPEHFKNEPIIISNQGDLLKIGNSRFYVNKYLTGLKIQDDNGNIIFERLIRDNKNNIRVSLSAVNENRLLKVQSARDGFSNTINIIDDNDSIQIEDAYNTEALKYAKRQGYTIKPEKEYIKDNNFCCPDREKIFIASPEAGNIEYLVLNVKNGIPLLFQNEDGELLKIGKSSYDIKNYFSRFEIRNKEKGVLWGFKHDKALNRQLAAVNIQALQDRQINLIPSQSAKYNSRTLVLLDQNPDQDNFRIENNQLIDKSGKVLHDFSNSGYDQIRIEPAVDTISGISYIADNVITIKDEKIKLKSNEENNYKIDYYWAINNKIKLSVDNTMPEMKLDTSKGELSFDKNTVKLNSRVNTLEVRNTKDELLWGYKLFHSNGQKHKYLVALNLKAILDKKVKEMPVPNDLVNKNSLVLFDNEDQGYYINDQHLYDKDNVLVADFSNLGFDQVRLDHNINSIKEPKYLIDDSYKILKHNVYNFTNHKVNFTVDSTKKGINSNTFEIHIEKDEFPEIKQANNNLLRVGRTGFQFNQKIKRLSLKSENGKMILKTEINSSK